MDSTFVYVIISKFGLNPALTSLLVTIVLAVIGYIVSEIKNKIKAPKIAQANFTAGVVIGSEVLHQESKDILGTVKADHVMLKVSDALKDPKIPEVDSKVEKAIKAGGGVLNLISSALTILTKVKPNVFKSKQ